MASATRAARALSPYRGDGPRTHFVSNVDGADLADTLAPLDLARTLFIVSSKTFTTLETLTNARSALAWFKAQGGSDVARHFVALTAQPQLAAEWGRHGITVNALCPGFFPSKMTRATLDKDGAFLVAGTPTGLANALRRIDSAVKQIPMDADPATAHMFIIKPGMIRGLASLFSTHPPTERRIEALQALLVLCSALTVHALHGTSYAKPAHVLAGATSLDMSDWWEATGDAYLGRGFPHPGILRRSFGMRRNVWRWHAGRRNL